MHLESFFFFGLVTHILIFTGRKLYLSCRELFDKNNLISLFPQLLVSNNICLVSLDFHLEDWFSRRLQQTEISLLTNDACTRYWGEDIKNTNICGSATGTTSCAVRNGCGILSLNGRSVILHLGPVN